jgi:hypothetical protein
MVSRSKTGHCRPHLLDDAGALVASTERQDRGLVAYVVVDIAVAESGGNHPNEYLVLFRLVHLHVTHFPTTG